MSNDCCGNCGDKGAESEVDEKLKKRPRSPTLLNLAWLRDRLKKVERIKERLASNSYQIDPEKVAKSIVNDE